MQTAKEGVGLSRQMHKWHSQAFTPLDRLSAFFQIPLVPRRGWRIGSFKIFLDLGRLLTSTSCRSRAFS